MTLPLPLRNRLAELILDAFRDSGSRAALETLSRCCQGSAVASISLPPSFPVELFDLREGKLVLKGAYRRFHDALCDRVGRAGTIVKDWPLSDQKPSLSQALDEAAALFDARLDFEVHELLEPLWEAAEGESREALQGLIQVAVGYHHLANGNLPGARSLLGEGSSKLLGRRVEGRDLDAFAVAVRRSREAIGTKAGEKFDWSLVPRFPRVVNRESREE